MRAHDSDDGFDDAMAGPFWWEDPALPEPDWRALFRGATDREILRNLIEGDPLQTYAYSWAFICENAVLVEPERLFLRVSARMSVRARTYRGQPPLLDWMSEIQESSIKDLMEEDLDAERRGLGIDSENLPGFRALVPKESTIEDDSTRRATVVFNHFTEAAREPFFRVMVQGYSAEEYAEESGLSLDAVVESLSKTTEALVRGCIAPFDKGDPLAYKPQDLP